MPATDNKDKPKISGLQRIIKGMDDLLKPLTDVTQKDFIDEAFASIGIVNVNMADIKRDKIDDFLKMESDKAGFLPFGEAMVQMTAIVKKLYDAVDFNIKNFSGHPFERDRLIDDLTTAVINILTMEWFRKVSPGLHNAFMILYSLNNFSNRGGGVVPSLKMVGGYWKRWSESFNLETAEEARKLSEFFFVIGTVSAYLINSKLSDAVSHENIETRLLVGGQYGSEIAYKDKLETPRDFFNELLGRSFTLSISMEKENIIEEALATFVMLSKEDGQSGVEVFLNKGISINSIPLSDNWFLSFAAKAKMHFRTGGTNTDGDVDLSKSSLALAFERLVFEKNTKPEDIEIPEVFDFFQFGFGNLSLQLEASPKDLTLRFVTQVTYATLKSKTVDGKEQKAGFPFKFIPEMRNIAEIPLRYSIKNGFGFDGDFVGSRPAAPTTRSLLASENGGSQGGTFTIPIHRELSIVRFDKLHIGFDTEGGLALMVTLDFAIKFGSAVVISIMEMGTSIAAVERTEKPISGGILGYDIKPAFLPPKGAGIAIDAKVVKGGGFLYFDSKKHEYFGAIELEVTDLFALKAIGIIRTRDNAGREQFSFLVLVTAEFTPIQLGFGFTLNGVGGLLALNRRANVQYLQEGLSSGVLQNILFPRDVIANMSRIISDLSSAFPIADGRFVVGLMAKIGWGTPTKIAIELGIILELPDVRILLPGILRANFPTEEKAILKIEAAFIGVLDFKNQFVYFRADLVNSRILSFQMTGSVVFGISWGTPSVFVLSAGGFHPKFREIPSLPTMPNAFKNLQRIGIQLLDDDNPRISVQTYFAITSNTVQVGGKAELYYYIAYGYNIYGRLEVNALFQFNPFFFIFDIAAEIALRDGTDWVMGIGLYGTLEGPTPWHLNGTATIKMPWYLPDIDVDIDMTWGNKVPTLPTKTAKVLAEMKAALRDTRNWKAKTAQRSGISLRQMDTQTPTTRGIDDEPLRLEPNGRLSFSQTVAPLNFTLQKFGEQLADVNNFSIKSVKIGTKEPIQDPVRDLFAADMYVQLSIDERLKRPSFEQMVSGFELKDANALKIGSAQMIDVSGEISEVNAPKMTNPSQRVKMSGHNSRLVRMSSAAYKSEASAENRARRSGYEHLEPTAKNTFAVATKDQLKNHFGTASFGSFAEAQQALQKESKATQRNLQVVGNHELV